MIAGGLELCTVLAEDGAPNLRIRHAGADEWYTLPGAGHRLHDPRDLETLHQVLVNVLQRPVAA